MHPSNFAKTIKNLKHFHKIEYGHIIFRRMRSAYQKLFEKLDGRKSFWTFMHKEKIILKLI
jgi:hypothetical protein